MRNSPLGVMITPKTITEQFVLEAALKCGCLPIVNYELKKRVGYDICFICRYNGNELCFPCLHDYNSDSRPCGTSHGAHPRNIDATQLELDRGIHVIIEDGRVMFASPNQLHMRHAQVWKKYGSDDIIRQRLTFELADPSVSIPSIAEVITTILNNGLTDFLPEKIDIH